MALFIIHWFFDGTMYDIIASFLLAGVLAVMSYYGYTR